MPERTPLRPRSPRPTVLLVDDEPRLRTMMVRAVREAGFACETAASAEEGMRQLQQHRDAARQDGPSAADPIGIAIVDLNLPGMDGLSFLEAMRERWPTVQPIVLTGYGDLTAAQRAIRLDAVDFLAKPCRLDELERALDKAWQCYADKNSPAEFRLRERMDADWSGEAPEQDALRSGGAPQLNEGTSGGSGGTSGGGASGGAMEVVERQHILATLRKHGGNRRATAAELGISLRKLYYRLAQYDQQSTPE